MLLLNLIPSTAHKFKFTHAMLNICLFLSFLFHELKTSSVHTQGLFLSNSLHKIVKICVSEHFFGVEYTEFVR